MKNTTLCYLVRGQEVLLLHRVKKKNDLNHDKWIGVGGKFEEDESPEDCLRREVREETGLELTHWRYCGIVTFVSDRYEGEYMHLFLVDGFTGEMKVCDEGDLEWVSRSFMMNLPMWEGDRLFLEKMWAGDPFFSMKLRYRGDCLEEAQLNGAPFNWRE